MRTKITLSSRVVSLLNRVMKNNNWTIDQLISDLQLKLTAHPDKQDTINMLIADAKTLKSWG